MDAKLYGLEVDFLKLNDEFIRQTKNILHNKYRLHIDNIYVEAKPNKRIIILHKSQEVSIDIDSYDDDYQEVNETMKKIIKTMMDKFPEDFI
jgi:hypothetical protein